MRKSIRIKDIALRAGVSIGTVDRVLHKRGEVSEETQQKIQQIIDELDYRPNLLASSLASNTGSSSSRQPPILVPARASGRCSSAGR